MINFSGLTLGITVTLLILMYVANELSFENFQKNRRNIYRIALEWGTEGNKMLFAGSMPALAPALNSQFPEVKAAIRVRNDEEAVIKYGENQENNEPDLFFVDPEIFDIFSFDLIEGDPQNALIDPFSVVISRETAAKYFGTADPLDKEIFYKGFPMKITGVINDIPENTHLRCKLMVSYSTLKALGETTDQPWNQWGNDLTYFLIKNNIRANLIIPKLNEMLRKNAGESLASMMRIELQPLREIHWEARTRGDFGPKGNKTFVYIFLSAAVFVLMIACFNYLNLSISGYLGRIKEVGIRKTAGARKINLILQFLTESMLLILISALAGLMLFDDLYAKLYSYLGADFVLTGNKFITLSILVFIIVVVIGFISGGYSAFYVSGFSPVEALQKEPLGMTGKLSVRKLLIMLQFFISVILITATFAVYRQFNFMRNSDLGFNKEDVVILTFPGTSIKANSKYEVLKEELLKNSNIRSLTGAYSLPGINSQMNFSVRTESTIPENSVIIQALPADYGMVKTLGLSITEGRDLSPEFSTDRFESVMLNETAVRTLGLTNPVGTKLIIPGEDYKNGVQVIGVVKDFHLQSFRNKINPMLIYINPEMYICIAVRINSNNLNETIDYINSTWKTILPGINMNYRYMADVYDNQYDQEKKTGQLLSVFTALALFISCLGLYGFASHVIRRRIKEVGVRKVMGASATSISFLLSRQFSIWAIVSAVAACPVSYIMTAGWLRNFAFHFKIDIWIFVAAIGIELIITLLTVSLITWRMAIKNPVDALRYE